MMEFKHWFEMFDIGVQTRFSEWFPLVEASTSTARYSVEVNFRTNTEEVLKNFSKIVLGYVSAALKQNDYHVKQIFDGEPMRILVSTRNWDDGEWILIISFDAKNKRFILSKGFHNKDRNTVSVINTNAADVDSASELTAMARNELHKLKGEKDRHMDKLRPISLKRGPK